MALVGGKIQIRTIYHLRRKIENERNTFLYLEILPMEIMQYEENTNRSNMCYFSIVYQ